ncbi:23S rRNA (pseudouridine(1915)-N(3))-methyltransferase RlmH [Tindallia magadiensis]
MKMILLEQIYKGFRISRNKPYYKRVLLISQRPCSVQ